MLLFGVLVNSLSVIVGAFLGLLLKKGIPFKGTPIFNAGPRALSLYLAVRGILKSDNMVAVILCVIVGSIIGAWIDIDKILLGLGAFLAQKMRKFSASESQFAEAFVNTFIFVCVGAMSIIGAIESGMHGSYDIFYAKSIFDFVYVVIMASSMGIGCAFAGIAAFVYQAILTLSASVLAEFVPVAASNDMSCIGAIIVAGIALNILDVTSIKIGNLLPSIFMPIFVYMII